MKNDASKDSEISTTHKPNDSTIPRRSIVDEQLKTGVSVQVKIEQRMSANDPVLSIFKNKKYKFDIIKINWVNYLFNDVIINLIK